MTPVVDLRLHLGTGPVRFQRPLYVDLKAPCNHACPAGENIQAWLAFAQAGKYREAWETLVQDNPMPSIHGRVCYHPCETGCNRAELDSAVSIHAVERFLGDLAVEQGWTPRQPAPASGKRVLIVGAGPCGLSAAYHLALLGHAVEIHDASPEPGGMMHYGIPAYRLPRPSLMREIERIQAMGVKFVANHKVQDLLAEQAAGGFHATLVAIGAGIAKNVNIPARDAARILDAVELLRGMKTGEKPQIGRRVVIYGGGDTAMDAARTVKRLGAEETMIVYRRDRAHMPAHSEEADEAEAEGVKFHWLNTIKDIAGPTLTVEVMELDSKGKPQPSGRFEKLEADTVILALGEATDSDFLKQVPGIRFSTDGMVEVGPNWMTGHPGLFAGGDMVPGARSVTVSVGAGKHAARHIDAWLRGATYQVPADPQVVSFGMLHLPVYSDADPMKQPTLSAEERSGGFQEIISGLTEQQARYEAQRCLSCGNCFECDNCYAACPEDAIRKLGPGRRYEYQYDKCTGCAECFEICPCHAIQMVPEPRPAAGAPEPGSGNGRSATGLTGNARTDPGSESR
jgi:NADPH-dependent glutamate synthase beta subunit-like oxidoreductase